MTETTTPDPPTSTQLTDFWRALNGPEEEPVTTTEEPDPQVVAYEDPRRDARCCIECEFRADDSPGGWYEASEHRTATGHRYEHVKPAPKPLTPADIPAGQPICKTCVVGEAP